jgi:hypothetical protein
VKVLPSFERDPLPGPGRTAFTKEVLEEVLERRGPIFGKIESFKTARGGAVRTSPTRRHVAGEPELIVLGLFFGVDKDRIGPLDLLELGLRSLVPGIQVGMVLAGEPPVGLLDLRLGGAPGNTEDLIKIFGHTFISREAGGAGFPQLTSPV